MHKKINIGGQAVMEGVMIRSPRYNVVAVRKNKKITAKKEKLKQRKSKFFKMPVVRGFFNMIDMLVIGMRSLMWSAEQQAEEDEKITKPEITFTVIFSVLIAIGLFIALPYFLTTIIGVREETKPIVFNLIDGVLRVAVFLLYIIGISLIKDVKVLFQYHGAEHKAVNCYEKGCKLDLKNAKKFSTLHPRCGTAFIMIVLVVSIIVFSLIAPAMIYFFPSLAVMHIFPRKIILFFIRLAFIPLIAGISYEFLKLSAKYEHNPLMRLFILPGLLMQRITTKEPNKKQLEVAIEAVRKILKLEKAKIFKQA
ncbi:DUF1385 domain-containing protein [Candidatus Woesearchaeota archaeon]|nr:DUF1385 domain-containing protein [Candidatus Woesearchaeota archaeon]